MTTVRAGTGTGMGTGTVIGTSSNPTTPPAVAPPGKAAALAEVPGCGGRRLLLQGPAGVGTMAGPLHCRAELEPRRLDRHSLLDRQPRQDRARPRSTSPWSRVSCTRSPSRRCPLPRCHVAVSWPDGSSMHCAKYLLVFRDAALASVRACPGRVFYSWDTACCRVLILRRYWVWASACTLPSQCHRCLCETTCTLVANFRAAASMQQCLPPVPSFYLWRSMALSSSGTQEARRPSDAAGPPDGGSVPSGSCWVPWFPGWRCCPLPALWVPVSFAV